MSFHSTSKTWLKFVSLNLFSRTQKHRSVEQWFWYFGTGVPFGEPRQSGVEHYRKHGYEMELGIW